MDTVMSSSGSNGNYSSDEENRYDGDQKLPAINNDDEAISRRLQKDEWNDRLDIESTHSNTKPLRRSYSDVVAGKRQEQESANHDDCNNHDPIMSSLPTESSFRNEAAKATAAMIEQRKRAEELAMQQTPDGRAWLFVKQVLDLHSELSESTNHGLTAVAVDDMVFLCKVFLKCAADFESRGISSRVSLAYHYTKIDRMSGIRQHGLMTLADRKQKAGTDSPGRAAFGDGVYTAANPTAFRHFGDTGMIVAVMLGNTKRVPYKAGVASQPATNANTLIGNKIAASIDGKLSPQDLFADELVLQESRQCLPLMQFDSGLTRTDEGRDAVWKYHQELQKLCDQVFNGGKRTVLKRTLLPAGALGAPKGPPPKTVGIYVAPSVLPTYSPSDLFEKASRRKSSPNRCCAVCRESFWSSKSLVRLKACGHQYHKACIEEALKTSPKCPTCRTLLCKPQGHSPSGAMSVGVSPVPCKGFEQCGNSLVITYTILDGVQKSYHENPGVPFKGTTRVAYVPSNQEGRNLVKRLKYAFMQGLTFTIGTSLTTGKPNCVIWGSIHHKTSPSHGPHGFPDPHFFANCNRELDLLGVPEAY